MSRRALRVLLACLGSVAAPGCVGFSETPGRDVEFLLRDEAGQPLPEWWVLQWQECDRCDFGMIWTAHGVCGDPNTRTIQQLHLVRMTPAANRLFWTGSYEKYIGYFLLFPPGGVWTGSTWFLIVAPGQPDHWRFVHGRQYPWLLFRNEGDEVWRVEAQNAGPKPAHPDYYHADGYTGLQVAGLVEELNSAPGINRSDLKDFLRALLGLEMDKDYRHRLEAFLADLDAGR